MCFEMYSIEYQCIMYVFLGKVVDVLAPKKSTYDNFDIKKLSRRI